MPLFSGTNFSARACWPSSRYAAHRRRSHRALTNATLADDRITHYEWDAQRNRIGIDQYEHDGTDEGALQFGYDGDLALIDSTERLLAYRDRDFEYDLNGRLRAESYTTPSNDDRIRCYTYDVLGALHRWEDRADPLATGVPLATTCNAAFSEITNHAWVEYDLDATGRRIGRRAWTDTGDLDEERYWVYLDALNPIAQLDDEGRVTQLYVYGTNAHSPDSMITWNYGTCSGLSCTPVEEHHRILHDIRGSVRMVYNTTTGAITQRLDYDEFGVVTANTAPFAQPFDARGCDPTLGRWTAPDPIGFAGGDSNLYSYLGGRVVGFVDVTGEEWMRAHHPSSCLLICFATRETGRGAGGYVGCYPKGGLFCPCFGTIDPLPNPVDDCPELADLVAEHENEHIDDAIEEPERSVCTVEPRSPIGTLGPENDNQLREQECEHRRSTLRQLDSIAIGTTYAENATCRNMAKSAKSRLRNYIDHNCN